MVGTVSQLPNTIKQAELHRLQEHYQIAIADFRRDSCVQAELITSERL